MSDSPEFIYGYGSTKHIYGWSETASSIFGKGTVEHRFGLCGAADGYPHAEPDRPTCKRCLSKWQKGGTR
jgi:hypothetical protein